MAHVLFARFINQKLYIFWGNLHSSIFCVYDGHGKERGLSDISQKYTLGSSISGRGEGEGEDAGAAAALYARLTASAQPAHSRQATRRLPGRGRASPRRPRASRQPNRPWCHDRNRVLYCAVLPPGMGERAGSGGGRGRGGEEGGLCGK